MGKHILFIDYENVHNIDLSILQEDDLDIKIFVGKSQSKIPIEVVQEAQKLGKAVEWVQIDGNGPNALDFHIAYYLGKLGQMNGKLEFMILSKDKGFDPLIRHVNNHNIACRRINSLLELSKTQQVFPLDNTCMTAVLENLSKIAKNKRPRTRKTLKQHIKNLLRNKMSDEGVDKILDSLFVQKKLSEENNKLKYNL